MVDEVKNYLDYLLHDFGYIKFIADKTNHCL